MKARLPFIAAALWWGSLSALGLWVVPLLFVHLPSPAIAGNMAARLFSAQTWVACVCGLLLLLAARDVNADGEASLAPWANASLLFIVGGVLLALLNEFGVAPRIVARENLKLWHGLGSAMYLLQWLASGAVLWRLCKPGTTAQV